VQGGDCFDQKSSRPWIAADAKPHYRKPTYILFIFAQVRSRRGRMDASLAELGIHGPLN